VSRRRFRQSLGSSPPDPLSCRERGNGFVITHHGLDRWIERAELDHLELDRARDLLLAELSRGVLFGGQFGNEELLLLPCGLVAAIVRDDGKAFVKTVLLREHAIAGMESRGIRLRHARVWPSHKKSA